MRTSGWSNGLLEEVTEESGGRTLICSSIKRIDLHHDGFFSGTRKKNIAREIDEGFYQPDCGSYLL